MQNLLQTIKTIQTATPLPPPDYSLQYADPTKTYGIPGINYKVKICNDASCPKYGYLNPTGLHSNGCFGNTALRDTNNQSLAGIISSITTAELPVTVYSENGCPSSAGKRYTFNTPGKYNGLESAPYGISGVKSIKVDYTKFKDGCALGIINPNICNKITISEADKATATQHICKGANLDTSLCREMCHKYGTCDTAVGEYCALEKNALDPFCKCVNIDPESKIPSCYDAICYARGYKTATMRATPCPALTLNQCNQYLNIKDDANQNALNDVQQQCKIMVANTTPTPAVPTGTGGTTSTTTPGTGGTGGTTTTGSATTHYEEDEDSTTKSYLKFFVLIICIIFIVYMKNYIDKKRKERQLTPQTTKPI